MSTRRVLLLASTTGYQTREFEDAARRLGVRLQYATDRCHVLDDPWRDSAIPVRFDRPEAAAGAIARSAARLPIDGVLAVGDAPTVAAAHAAQLLGLPFHSPDGGWAARDKLTARCRFLAAGLPVPAFLGVPRNADPRTLVDSRELAGVGFPCVLKPIGLSASRGVIRADDRTSFAAAFERIRELLEMLPADQASGAETILVEDFIPGREFAVEGVMTHGRLRVLAIFDKPDPLDGPFFEETIYVTPPELSEEQVEAVSRVVADGAYALGLGHGSIHAECRVNARGVYLLEIAGRPIGGLCARALQFWRDASMEVESLEAILLRHALGEPTTQWRREPIASGVMMMPVPRRGVLRGVTGLDRARATRHVTDVIISARADQVLVPWPEGASYLGFIFARAGEPREVVNALKTAHSYLECIIDPQLRVVQSTHHG
jgi:D-alanine-D-alanine ligase-like ATP-grasp enzyme